MSVTITIQDRPISKKRSYRRGKNSGFYLSQEFKNWEKSALWQLKSCKARFKGHVHIDYQFEMKGKLDTDMDNMRAGINDILEKAEIIDNDKNIVSDTGVKYGGFKDWRTVLKISKLT